MARVRFTADFDYKPKRNVTVGYLAGMEETVKRDCADQAIAAGKAEEIGKDEAGTVLYSGTWGKPGKTESDDGEDAIGG